MVLKRFRRPDRLPVIALASVATLATTVGIAKATGVALFHGKPITYPARHFDARPLELSVFEQAPTARDQAGARNASVRASIDVLTAPESDVPSEWLPGSARAGDVRVAFADLGPEARTLYLVRTTRGRVCAGLTGFTSGCLAGLPADVPVTLHAGDPDVSGGGEPALAWGVARDSVRRVDVVVDGVATPARLARNAFFFQLDDASASERSIEAVVVQLSNGASIRVPALHGPPPDAQVTIVKGGPPGA